MGGSTAELFRGVFSKTRSFKSRDGHGRSNAVEKRGWSSVKSYLCGDECNSVLGEKDSASFRQLEFSSVVADESSAHTRLCQIHSDFTEEDTASVKSSEATVTQPIVGEIPDQCSAKNILDNEELQKEKQNSTYKLFQQEDAALTIQLAFRSYLARRSSQVKELENGKQELIVETTNPSPESLGSSIKVQTGDSTSASFVDLESINLRQPLQKRIRVQVEKLQEDWDDSTVSSTLSKMRMQNRMEAATRRERALAYAFAQQLRVCSKKKRTKSNSLDTNMSWSWIERWMATRQPENSFFNNNTRESIELHSCNQQSLFRDKLMDATAEEESCGSNEVSIQIDGMSLAGHRTKDYLRPVKSKGKAVRNISRQQIVVSSQYPKEPKVSKNHFQAEDENDNKDKLKQPENKKEIKCQDSI